MIKERQALDLPSPTDFSCPFCVGPVVRYASGYSEYDLACDACEAGFVVDEATDVVRSRRWDRQAAQGVHQEFTKADLLD